MNSVRRQNVQAIKLAIKQFINTYKTILLQQTERRHKTLHHQSIAIDAAAATAFLSFLICLLISMSEVYCYLCRSIFLYFQFSYSITGRC